MALRTVLMSLVAAGFLVLPAWASQPEGYAGKLISNPPITSNVVDDNGLPPVTCLGFQWGEIYPSRLLDPTDTVTLEVAIIPFRSGSTDVLLPGLVQVRFADGLVNGLRYRRTGWNDVRVVLRPATQDYILTVNGAQAGPFANEYFCTQPGGCFTLEAIALRGTVSEESVAWIDSLSLVRNSAAGQDVILENGFDQCYASRNPILGGLLIVEPPQRMNPGGTL